MNKFILEFKNSLSNKEFYQNILNNTPKWNMYYVAKLSLMLSILLSLFIICGFYLSGFPRELRKEVAQNFPDNLVVNIKNGILSINQPVPYVVPLPVSLIQENLKNHEKSRTNLLVIDTDASLDLNANTKFDTMIFLSSNRAIIEQEIDGEIRSIPLKNFPDIQITKSFAIDKLNKFLNVAWLFFLLIIIPMFMVNFVSIMFISFFAGVFIFIILKIMSRKIPLKKAWFLAMYAYTFVAILEIITFVLQISIFFWYKVFISVLIIMFYIYKKEDSIIETSINNSENTPNRTT
ncbi:MAG: DUF1189 domain-containing protein [bacterium]|nr:DUF1189 domain-containing protein [bacterium]